MSLETGSKPYKIKPSRKFLKSFKDLKKRYYKGIKAQEAFTQTIKQITDHLSDDPFLAQLEPLPGKLELSETYEFRKYRFKMPNLKGASGQGRLMFLVDHDQCEIVLIWLYTHQEFAKRPPDQQLKQSLEEMKKSKDNNDEDIRDNENN